MSDSVRPHRWQTTMLLCPWNSPGKMTGVGCHSLLQGIFPTQGWNPSLMSPVLAAGGFFTTSAILSSAQSLSRVRLFATPWSAARQASLSITNSRSLLKLISIKSVMPSNHLILCCPLLPAFNLFQHQSLFK